MSHRRRRAPPPPPPPRHLPPPPAPASTEEFTRYATAIERIRESTFTRDVDVRHVPAGEVKAVLRRLMQRRMPGGDLEQWVTLLHGLRHLGFDSTSLVEELRRSRELWTGDAASMYTAVYDAASRTCLISSDTMKIEQEAVVVHELTHALQHQQGRLEGLERRVTNDLDGATARVGLIEGEAQVVAYLWTIFEAKGGGAPGRTASARTPPGSPPARTPPGSPPARMPPGSPPPARMPPALLASMLAETRSREELVLRRGGDPSGWFGYGRGALFVASLLEAGGWDRVRDAFVDPPLSTEQVLHPVKYMGTRDLPQSLRLPERFDALPPASRVLLETTLGEYQFFLWLLQTLPRTDAVHASVGWDGDRARLVRTGDGALDLAIVIASTWDSERDANQIAKALRRRAGEANPAVAKGPPVAGRLAEELRPPEGFRFGVRREGRDVAVVVVPEAVDREALLEEVLRFERMDPRRADPDGEPPEAVATAGAEDLASTRAEERRIERALEREEERRGWEVVGDEVRSRRFGFRLRLPGPEWVAALQSPNPMVHVLIVRHATGDNVNVVVTPGEADLDPMAIAEQARDQFVAAMTDEPAELEAIEFHGLAAAEMRYSLPMMGRMAHSRQIYVQANDLCYILTCTRVSEDPSIEAAFDRVLASFRLEE